MEQPIANNQPAPPQPGPVQTGKSGDPYKMWTIVFVILFVVAAGFGVWQTVQLSSQSSKVTDLESTTKALQQTNASLQSQLDELNGTDTSGDSTADTTNPESVKILAAVDAYVRAPVDAANGTFEYSIMKNADGFARVNVSGEGGYAVWLKKVSDNWTVIATGQENPTQADIDKYSIPSSVLM